MTSAKYVPTASSGSSGAVDSVAGKTGVVTLDHATDLANVGTNTHAVIDTALAAAVARQIIAGAGLTGGGTLAADRTLNVIANADASIVVNANDIQVGLITAAQHGAQTTGTLHAAAIAAGASGFMTGADKTKLDGIVAGAQADHTGLSNIGTNTHAQIDTALATAAAIKAGVMVNVSITQTLGTTQPLSVADATMTGLTAGGSTVGTGTSGVVALSTASSSTETGSGSGQAGLGANSPLTDSAFAGQRVPVTLLKQNGNDLQLADILLVTTGLDPLTRVYGYLAFRSDLAANAKWRLWFYYRRNSDGVEVAITPTISVTNAQVFAPIIYPQASVPLASEFNATLAAGERAAEIAAGSITTAMLADALLTTAKFPVAGTTIAMPGSLSIGESVSFPGVATNSLTSSQNDLAITNADTTSTWLITPSGPGFSITGFVAPTAGAGSYKVVRNPSTTDSFSITHQSGSSSAANRVVCPNGTTLVVPAMAGLHLRYGGDSRWHPIMTATGGVTPTTLTFNDSAVIGTSGVAADANHGHAHAAVPGSGAEIQYRSSASAMAAAARATIDTNNIAIITESSDVAPAVLSGACKIFATRPSSAFPTLPAFQPDLGTAFMLQPTFTSKSFAAQLPLTTTTVTIIGHTSDTGGGTVSNPTVADTNNYSRRLRVNNATAASAGSSARFRMFQHWSVNIGYDTRFSDVAWPVLAASSRGIFAMYNTTIGNVEPDTLLNIVGVGFRTTDTNLFVFHNDGSGTCTALDLGSNFPVSVTARYKIRIFCDAGGSNIMVETVRIDSAFTDTRTLSTNIPVAATLVGANAWINNGATASASQVEICAMTTTSNRAGA